MDALIIKSIAGQLGVRTAQVETVLKMLEEGDTVPFIARYRKEATGALDEEQIRSLLIPEDYTGRAPQQARAMAARCRIWATPAEQAAEINL